MNSAEPAQNTEPDVAFFECVICNQKWPEHLTVRHGAEHLCCPCHGKLKSEAFRKANQHLLSRYRIGESAAPKLSLFGWLGVVLLLGLGLLYGGFVLIKWATRPKVLEVPKVSLFQKDVGRIFVKSAATLKAGRVRPGTAFFCRAPEGVYAVVHALPASMALDPNSNALPCLKWTFSQPEKPGLELAAIGLARAPGLIGRQLTWLLEFKPADVKQPPVAPLKPQLLPASVGDHLRLARAAIHEDKIDQEFASSRVENVFSSGEWFTVALEAPIAIRDVMGMPLVNDAGELVGIVDGYGAPDAEGNVRFLEAVGALDLLGIMPPPPPPKGAAKPKPAAGTATAKKPNPVLPNGSP